MQKRKPKGLGGVLMYLYCYGLIALAFLPQIYIVYLSFRNCEGAVFKPGFSLINYEKAMKKLLVRSIENTVIFGVVSWRLSFCWPFSLLTWWCAGPGH